MINSIESFRGVQENTSCNLPMVNRGMKLYLLNELVQDLLNDFYGSQTDYNTKFQIVMQIQVIEFA
jgi:hypothetical protein